ncbi:MAG: hypothetical protein PHN39_02320 [Candidatus Pacebacteria bacterium]|nr:hypothetical protein [Candidatus Paceibacterota bacterium]
MPTEYLRPEIPGGRDKETFEDPKEKLKKQLDALHKIIFHLIPKVELQSKEYDNLENLMTRIKTAEERLDTWTDKRSSMEMAEDLVKECMADIHNLKAINLNETERIALMQSLDKVLILPKEEDGQREIKKAA